MVPDAGHWLMYEAADFFNAFAREFMERETDGGSKAVSAGRAGDGRVV